jgi:antitoxin component of RelBE/YafQ-DinJ toxin-antitoxin module
LTPSGIAPIFRCLNVGESSAIKMLLAMQIHTGAIPFGI